MKLSVLAALLISSFLAHAQTNETIYGYVDSATFKAAEIRPAYPGGQGVWIRFLHQNLRYPISALKHNLSGIVVIEFTIDMEGRTSDYKVVHPADPDLDKESIRLIKKSGIWTAAILNGRQVVYRNRQEIEFRIGNDGNN